MSATAHHKRRSDCRLCGSKDLALVFQLEPTPPANAFLKASQLNEPEEKFPLDVFFCRSCNHVQLLDVVDPELLFGNYVYVSGTSPVFVEHFRKYAGEVLARQPKLSSGFAFEIGSNDGTLLRFFQQAGWRVLGADPAKDIAQSATESGIPTLPIFFNAEAAREIREKHGTAHAILANNVFAHIDDLKSVALGVKELLSPQGFFVFEVSYLLDVIEKTLFDTIYHEHLCYHSLGPLVGFFHALDLEVFDAERVSSHGGSLRVYVQHKGAARSLTQNVAALLELEQEFGLYREETFRKFAHQIDALGRELNSRLKALKVAGKRIAAFGAPAKATTLMHHFKMGRELIDFIVDDSPLKQGLFAPGTHIPVCPSTELYSKLPDYSVVLAWNFADSIIAKNKKYQEQGGRFIVPLPQLKEY
jgi:hypothetical protein